MMSIQFLLIRQSFEVRFDKQGHNRWGLISIVLAQIVYVMHLGLQSLAFGDVR